MATGGNTPHAGSSDAKKAGRNRLSSCERKPYWAGAGSAGAGSIGSAAGGLAGSAGAGSVVVVSGTLCVVVLSAESLHAATLSKARAETEARTSFFMTISFRGRPSEVRRSQREMTFA